MFKYNDISFRVIEKADLDILRSLHNDPTTYMNILSIDFIDEEDQLNWWKNLHTRKNDRRFVLCFSDSPEKVFGRLRIQNINEQHRNCEIGIDIHPDYRNLGLAKKSYAMTLRFLFHEMNMNMVYLRVAEFNQTATDLYKKCGFKETGRYPSFFYRNGRYWDYTLMTITKQDYQP